MKLYKQNRQSDWKREISRFVILLFVVYAFAEVSVLQAYCGSESVGIPSYTQQVRAEQCWAESANNAQEPFKNSDSFPQDQTPDLPDSEENCFCCCSDTLLGFSLTKSYLPILVIKESGSNFSYKYLQTGTYLWLIYQPPKLA